MSDFGSGYEGWGKLTDLPGKADLEPKKDERYEEYVIYTFKGEAFTRRRRITNDRLETEHFVTDCPPGDVKYVYGIWDRQSKYPDGCPVSVRYAATRNDYRTARRFARRRSRDKRYCDFLEGTEGESIVLIEYRNGCLQRIWEFDRKARERLILDYT